MRFDWITDDIKKNKLVVVLGVIVLIQFAVIYSLVVPTVPMGEVVSGKITAEAGGSNPSTDATTKTDTDKSTSDTGDNNEVDEVGNKTTLVGNWGVKITSMPSGVKAGKDIKIEWEITAPAKASVKTAIKYGDDSFDTKLTSRDAVEMTPYIKSSTVLETLAPGVYTTTIKISSSGTYYLRAHAQIGNFNYWSSEKKLVVN